MKLKAFRNYEVSDINKAADKYTELLKDVVKTPVVPEGYYSSWAQYTIQLSNKEMRDGLQNYLKEAGIPSMVYYPKPMHKQQAFSNLDFNEEDYVNTNKLCDTVLSLPMHPYLTEEEQTQVVKVVKEYLK